MGSTATRLSVHLVVLVLGLLLTAAHPNRARATGLNLSWDACGHAGQSNKAFACNTNTGEERLVFSGKFHVDGMLPELRFIADVDFASAQMELPLWWSIGDVGACRPGVLSMGLDPSFAELANCQWTEPSNSVYTMSWSTSGSSPLRRRLTIAGTPVRFLGVGNGVDSLESWVGTLRISHARTVGAGSCSGCATPVCIVFNSLQVFDPISPYTLRSYVTGPLERNFVTWQGGASGMAICPAATPARNRTWGSLKSLHR